MNFRLFGKEKRVGLMVDLMVYGIVSASDSEHEVEHLKDAPQNQSHYREDGVCHCVEQHKEKTKYHHSTFDFRFIFRPLQRPNSTYKITKKN